MPFRGDLCYIIDAIRSREEEHKIGMQVGVKQHQNCIRELEVQLSQRQSELEKHRREVEIAAQKAQEKARREAEQAAIEFERQAAEIRRQTQEAKERTRPEAEKMQEEIRRIHQWQVSHRSSNFAVYSKAFDHFAENSAKRRLRRVFACIS